MKALTAEYTQQVLKKIEALPQDASPQQIQQTADQLSAMSYQPMLLNDAPDFFHITKDRLGQMVNELANEPNTTEQHLNLLVYHYELLQRLRRDEPEAWDEVNELMEDD